MSDGNSTTCFRSRWVRWMMTGIAKVASATKNNGARKAMSAHPAQALPRREIFEERVVERRRCVQQRVVDAVLRHPRRQRRDVLLDQPAILVGQRRRHHRNLLAGLEILETRRLVEVEFD